MKKVVYLLFLLFTVACHKEEELTGGLLDSTVQIEAKIDKGTERIFLFCKTAKKYDCYNYKIATTTQTNGQPFHITFRGIIEASQCANASGPARAEINLGDLQAGEYALTLAVGDFSNNGTLQVTETEISLSFPQQNGIEILTPVIQR